MCEKLFKIDSGSDNNGNVVLNLAWWRTRTFEDLRYSNEIQSPENFEQEAIFKNAAAKEAVDAMRGYLFANTEENHSSYIDDATIMTLSRTQAYITGAMYVMRNKMQQGSATGAAYSRQYERLLPRSTEKLLSQCRSILKLNHPRDLEVNRSDSFGTSPLFVTREASRAIGMQHTKEIYLSVTP